MDKLFLLIFLGLMSSVFGGIVEDGLKQLSWHERICMKKFFDEAMRMDQLCHVLFYDNKPICLTALILKDKQRQHQNILCLKGWKIFKENEHLFPHPNFLINENIVEFDDNFVALHIYIINKVALMKCLENHLEIFREFFGNDFSPIQFLAKIENGRSIPDLLKDNEMLMGILLGYGEESSRAFHEATSGHSLDYSPPELETYCAIELNQPKGCKLFPITFMGNPNSPEVSQLGSIYEIEIDEIWQTYRSSKKRLTMALKRLCSE